MSSILLRPRTHPIPRCNKPLTHQHRIIAVRNAANYLTLIALLFPLIEAPIVRAQRVREARAWVGDERWGERSRRTFRVEGVAGYEVEWAVGGCFVGGGGVGRGGGSAGFFLFGIGCERDCTSLALRRESG